MPSEPYLIRLSRRLFSGLSHLEPERKRRHADFLLSRQMPDGGFRGREGDSDLYYTSFAIRGLAMLSRLDRETAVPISRFLDAFNPLTLSIVDLLSWLSSQVAVQLAGGPVPSAMEEPDWATRVAERL